MGRLQWRNCRKSNSSKLPARLNDIPVEDARDDCVLQNYKYIEAMAKKKRVGKTTKKINRGVKSASGGKRPRSSAASAARPAVSMGDVLEYYKPIKKPVTLRLDADVLAWFRKDGRRYQTRINSALRGLMKREMKKR